MSEASAKRSKKNTITANQWKGFIGAFGGWTLDGFNVAIFSLVLAPAMTELLPKSGYTVNAVTIGYFGQVGVAIFLLGWGCSFIWGPIADRFGRLPAMTYSILVYAVFTFVAGFSQNMWQLALFRFIAAVGIGGEWAMAGTLVAETMPERWRPMFGGILHSGVYIGTLLCSIINYAVGVDLGWRWMFYLGIAPAAFVMYIRTQSKETPRWTGISQQSSHTAYAVFLAKILKPPYRRLTSVNTALLFVALTGLWAATQYLGVAILNIATARGIEKRAALRMSSLGLGLVYLFTILGCLAVPWLANRLGRRGALALLFGFMTIGIGGGFGWGYYTNRLIPFLSFIPILGIGGANLAVFTLWLPEQYPTEIRATAFAFCTTISRLATAASTFLVAHAITVTHTIRWPLALTAVPFLLGIGLAYAAPETRSQTLPD